MTNFWRAAFLLAAIAVFPKTLDAQKHEVKDFITVSGTDTYSFHDIIYPGRTPIYSAINITPQYQPFSTSICNKLILMKANDHWSWVFIPKEGGLQVDVTQTPWVFSGNKAAENKYLYTFTTEMFFDRANKLTNYYANTTSSKTSWSPIEKNIGDLFTEDYLNWEKALLGRCMKTLDQAKLTDQQFVKQQRVNIYGMWLDMQFQNFDVAFKARYDVPARAFDFLDDIKFDDPDFILFNKRYLILNDYFRMKEFSGRTKDYTSSNFLAKRLEKIADPQIKEFYAISEMEYILERGWTYKADQLIASIEPVLVSEKSKEALGKIKETYRKMLQDPLNCEGKDVFPFEFVTVVGDTVRLSDYKGKYLLLDVWNITCSRCIYEYPFLFALEKELHGKNIAFLPVSIDQVSKIEEWKQMSKKIGLGDRSCLSPNTKKYDLFLQIPIEILPRYILISPEGKIIMTQCRYPSDPILKMQLKELAN